MHFAIALDLQHGRVAGHGGTHPTLAHHPAPFALDVRLAQIIIADVLFFLEIMGYGTWKTEIRHPASSEAHGADFGEPARRFGRNSISAVFPPPARPRQSHRGVVDRKVKLY
ncbi:MAG: hypothetical protein ABFS23_05250 [Pseudomonadota bacterium]